MSKAERRDPDSVDDVFGEDHQVLGALLERLRSAIPERSPEALATLEAFTLGLRAHMSWEEELLFPAVFAHATSAQKRSIESLEIDHERLRETLSSLHSSLAAGDFATARTLADWLETLLRGHNYDEEHGVYVEADQYLTEELRRRLIEQFRHASRKPRP
ncbi:MAG TPA: hemerythrin domain-containing protein [Planctomycetota bacterium]|jgi:hemerythrin-like domain-containing protein|nr:hemerythrin domain-containing protein [Planctomycetota bacterium]